MKPVPCSCVIAVVAVTEALMAPAQYPHSSGTRNLHDNLSDLRAQVAANQKVCICCSLFLKIVKHDSWPIQPDILNPPLLRLTSRKPLWLHLQPDDIKSRWRDNWKSAQVVNSHLVCDPTIRQPGFDLPRHQWSLLAEPFSHGTGTLRCLQKEMATYRHWSVSLWRNPDDVPHCWIEWRLISAALCGWSRCFMAD